MQPVTRKLLIAVDARLCLRDLVLMMREDEVAAAAVEVEGITEIFYGHCRALDVPAGTPLSPRALPRGFTGLCRLPEGEVHRVLLRLVDLNACSRLHVFEAASAEATVP